MSNTFIGKNIKYFRKKQDRTQASIALHVNKRNTAISSWENGLSVPPLEDIFKLARLFGVNADLLLSIDFENANPFDKYLDEEIEDNANLNAHRHANLNPKAPSQYEDLYTVYEWNEPGIHFKKFLSAFELFDQLPHFYLPDLGLGLHIRYELTTESMKPTLISGNRIVATYLRPPETTLKKNEVYLIIDAMGEIACGRLTKSRSGIVEFAFDNHHFKPIKHNLKDLLGVFKVIEVHSRNLRQSVSNNVIKQLNNGTKSSKQTTK